MSLLKLRGPPVVFLGEYCLPFHFCLNYIILLAAIMKLNQKVQLFFFFFFWGGGGGEVKRVGTEWEEVSMATLTPATTLRGLPRCLQ